jgi:hypothetical protein
VSLVQLAPFLVFAASIGWTMGRLFPDPPAGTDPEFWRATYRRWRKRRKKA